MSKYSKFNISLVFVICLLCIVLCSGAFADEADAVPEFAETPVYIDGLLSLRGYLLGDTTYISLETGCAVLGYEYSESVDEENNALNVIAADIEFTVEKDKKYIEVLDRCLFLPDGYVELDGVFMVPIDFIAKLFTLNVVWDDLLGAYDLDSSTEALLLSGSEYYNEEDLYWLSRIITYESGNQPIEGQIGVGNVVLNRVASENFADTVKEVIFEPGQFSPVARKSIYLDPFDKCVLSAKLVLEGYNTVDNALYFHQGDYGEKITTENEYFVTKIGVHNFFVSIENLKYM